MSQRIIWTGKLSNGMKSIVYEDLTVKIPWGKALIDAEPDEERLALKAATAYLYGQDVMNTPKSQAWKNRPKAYREKNSGNVVRISHPGLLAEVKAAKARADLDGAAQALREHRERCEKPTK